MSGVAVRTLLCTCLSYCAHVWCRSAHTRLIDPVINNALRIVTGCLLPTPTDYLKVLAGIPPAELCRRQAKLTLACRALEPDHLFRHKIISPELRQSRRLKSRHPFVPAAREPLFNLNQLDIRATDWAEHSWRSEWNNCNTRLHYFIYNIDTPPPGMHLPRRSWVRLNHLRNDSAHPCTTGEWFHLRHATVAPRIKRQSRYSLTIPCFSLLTE